MKSKILIFILIFFFVLSADGFPSKADTPSASEEAYGPGVYVSTKGSRSPRIVTQPSAKKTDETKEEETLPGTESPKTEAGASLSGASELSVGGVPTVETVLLPEKSREEKVAADLLLEEQQRPKTGELFHSNRHFSTSALITISNLGEDDTVMRFLTEEDVLVFSVYIRHGDKIKVQIPGGTYRMRQAFGEKWYGIEDMFGNCGRYCDCTIGGNPFFEIKRSGRYVISTMGQGDAFSKVEIGKEEF